MKKADIDCIKSYIKRLNEVENTLLRFIKDSLNEVPNNEIEFEDSDISLASFDYACITKIQKYDGNIIVTIVRDNEPLMFDIHCFQLTDYKEISNAIVEYFEKENLMET